MFVVQVAVPVAVAPLIGVESWAAQVGASHGFSDVEHTMELTGTCAGCALELGQGAG